MEFPPPPRKKKGHEFQPEEAPFPIPIQSLTRKPASDTRWFYYSAKLLDNVVIIESEGDMHFLYRMGFFGKGILSRGRPEHAMFASSFQGIRRKNLPAHERRFQQSRYQKVRQHKYERHLSWKKQQTFQMAQRTQEIEEDGKRDKSSSDDESRSQEKVKRLKVGTAGTLDEPHNLPSSNDVEIPVAEDLDESFSSLKRIPVERSEAVANIVESARKVTSEDFSSRPVWEEREKLTEGEVIEERLVEGGLEERLGQEMLGKEIGGEQAMLLEERLGTERTLEGELPGQDLLKERLKDKQYVGERLGGTRMGEERLGVKSQMKKREKPKKKEWVFVDGDWDIPTEESKTSEKKVAEGAREKEGGKDEKSREMFVEKEGKSQDKWVTDEKQWEMEPEEWETRTGGGEAAQAAVEEGIGQVEGHVGVSQGQDGSERTKDDKIHEEKKTGGESEWRRLEQGPSMVENTEKKTTHVECAEKENIPLDLLTPEKTQHTPKIKSVQGTSGQFKHIPFMSFIKNLKGDSKGARSSGGQVPSEKIPGAAASDRLISLAPDDVELPYLDIGARRKYRLSLARISPETTTDSARWQYGCPEDRKGRSLIVRKWWMDVESWINYGGEEAADNSLSHHKSSSQNPKQKVSLVIAEKVLVKKGEDKETLPAEELIDKGKQADVPSTSGFRVYETGVATSSKVSSINSKIPISEKPKTKMDKKVVFQEVEEVVKAENPPVLGLQSLSSHFSTLSSQSQRVLTSILQTSTRETVATKGDVELEEKYVKRLEAEEEESLEVSLKNIPEVSDKSVGEKAKVKISEVVYLPQQASEPAVMVLRQENDAGNLQKKVPPSLPEATPADTRKHYGVSGDAGYHNDVDSDVEKSSSEKKQKTKQKEANPQPQEDPEQKEGDLAAKSTRKPNVRNPDPYPIKEFLQLSFEEAFFLSYGLGCLSVTKESNKEPLSLTEMWKEFKCLKPRFPATYVAYHYYRSRGWVPRCGMKYGCDLVVYKKGPDFYHSSLAVVVEMVHHGEESSRTTTSRNLSSWTNLTGFNRIIENAAKEVCICFVYIPSTLSEADLESPTCIPYLSIQKMWMKRWRPTRERQQTDVQPLIS